ncbi:MAG: LysR substrate-binding domain-containing protein [Bacteroidetes bacterium]|nr:LysR substrate-binding domain-containing protein [Bacteroidota bacterium]
MTLTQYQYIVAVDIYKSFAKAADHCFVTQPTLSMQIQKLEEELGVTLFDRSKKPVATTDIGRQIVDQAKVLLNEAGRINEIIQLNKGEVKGQFRLAFIPTIAPSIIPRFLKDFTELYPNLELHITELQTEIILDQLKKGLIDAAVVATPLGAEGVIEKPLYIEPFMGFVPESHRLYKEKFLTTKELDINDLLLLKEGHCFRNSVINLCNNAFKKNDKSASIHLESGNFETLIKLAKQGFGMTLIPYLLSLDLKETDDKKYIRPFEKPQPSREISIIYRRAQLKIHIIEKIADAIKKSVPKHMVGGKEMKVVEPV